MKIDRRSRSQTCNLQNRSDAQNLTSEGISGLDKSCITQKNTTIPIILAKVVLAARNLQNC